MGIHKIVRILTPANLFLCPVFMTKMTHFLHCYAIAGSCKEPSKKPKGGSNESEEDEESKPFLSKSLAILVTITYSVH